LLTVPDSPEGYAGPYLCLYAWEEAVFRSLRVSVRPHDTLEDFLTPAARARCNAFPTGRLSAHAVVRPPVADTTARLTLYVAPSGNDAWSGRVTEPNADKTDGPLATPQAAIAALGAYIRSEDGLPSSAEIRLHGGTYALNEPLRITPAEGGRHGTYHAASSPPLSVTVRAYGDSVPVLSGGRRIEGFAVTNLNECSAWVADVPAVRAQNWSFTQLWVNGERRARPRLPRQGFYRVAALADGQPFPPIWSGHRQDAGNRFIWADGDLNADWRNLREVEVHFFNYWGDDRMRVQSVDAARRLVTLDRSSSFSLGDDTGSSGAVYVVENVFEALAAPGDWYLDRSAGRLFYLPQPGESIATAEVVAPALSCLVAVEGMSAAACVEEVHFEGLAFAHSEWPIPDGWSASAQAAVNVPGAVVFTNAILCSLRNCRVEHVGSYGVEFAGGCRDMELEACRITDLGAGGVKVGAGCARSLIADNVIAHGGRLFHEGVGILIGDSGGHQVLHNAIYDFDYSGVSVGWRWGYDANTGYGNVVEWNDIHDIGHGRLSDMGGIYTLGMQPGTRIRFNRIHDVVSRTYGGWGIYLDEGSSYLLVENNLCYRCKTGGFHQHYGKENVVRNNIFALSTSNELQRTRVELHESFAFQHNIVLTSQGLMWLGDWKTNAATVRSNLYEALAEPLASPAYGGRHEGFCK